jgi:hypothetical protein
LRRVAKQHQIQINQAEEIFELFCKKIGSVVAEEDKFVNGFYHIDKFPIIHIDNFGKFIPSPKHITKYNKGIEINKKRDEEASK